MVHTFGQKALFNSRNYDSSLQKKTQVTVSKHEQYEDPETEAAEWNSFQFILIISPLFFSCDMLQ